MPRDITAYVYIMSSHYKVLYIGITTELAVRVTQHKNGSFGGFTSQYKVHRLVYYEAFAYINDAIAREKELKGWLRLRKVALIVKDNPAWKDLSADWGKPTEPFDEAAFQRKSTKYRAPSLHSG